MAKAASVFAALIAVAVVIAAALAVARYEPIRAVDDRLATAYTVGDAEFSVPGTFTWPRLSEDEAWAKMCGSCGRPANATAEYGILTSDPALGAFRSYAVNLPNVAGPVTLPRVAWILQWPLSDFCRDYSAAPHTLKCANFEVIDDSTGWILDAGQNLTP